MHEGSHVPCAVPVQPLPANACIRCCSGSLLTLTRQRPHTHVHIGQCVCVCISITSQEKCEAMRLASLSKTREIDDQEVEEEYLTIHRQCRSTR